MRIAFVAAIVAIGLLLRVGYAVHGMQHPESSWQQIDPDSYRDHGRLLVRDGTWRWTLDAVRFSDGPLTGYVKAPLYQIFLSSFARFTPEYPKYVPLGHALLGALTTIAVFMLARWLHSPRAGLIAAAIHATWFLSIVSVASFWQEQLYIPLVTWAAALFVRNRRTESLTGIVFALAALTRSMALWLTPLALLWRRGRVVAVCAAIVTAYVVYLSLALGRLVLVENVGTAYMAFNDPPGIASPREPRGAASAPNILARQIAADPVHVARSVVYRVRSTMTIGSHRWLEFHEVFETESGATFARAAVLVSEIVVAIVLLLAPIGAAAASNRRGALWVAAWIISAVLLTALAGHHGPRFRAPLDPLLIALAACALAGPRVRVDRGSMLVSGMMAVAIGLSVPDGLRVRGNFGIAPWHEDADTRQTYTRAATAGFGLRPIDGRFAVTIRCREPQNVTMAVNSRPAETISAAQCTAGTARTFEATVYSYVRLSAERALPVEVIVVDDHISPELMAANRGTHLAFQLAEWSHAGCGRAPTQ